MIVRVKTLAGREREIEIVADMTVLDLKRCIEKLELIPPEQQKLIYFGKIMDDDSKHIEEYNITPGSVIHMVLALRGG